MDTPVKLPTRTIESYKLAVAKLRDWAGLDDLASLTRVQATAFARHHGERPTASLFVRARRALLPDCDPNLPRTVRLVSGGDVRVIHARLKVAGSYQARHRAVPARQAEARAV